ncbi:MAG: helix-turn-helix domain-containing protein, partial [Planctomycetota bacterium]
MGVRQERREARTRELLDAAMELLVAEGLKGLTIGALAQQVDAAVGAIYRYFPSKTALLVALQLRAIEELRREVEAALARVDGA